MKKKVVSFLLAAVLGTVMLTGCGSGSDETVKVTATEQPGEETGETDETEAPSEETFTVHVGDQAAFFLVKTAVEKGFFEEEFATDNIEIDSEIFVNMGPAIIEAMGAGDVDLSIVGGFPIVNANNNGNKITVLSSGNYSEDGFHLVVAPGSSITTVEELKGGALGVPLGAAEHQIVLELLEKHGISGEVELVNLSQADALSAIINGDIDAALFNSGSLAGAEEAGCATIATNQEVGLVVNYVIGRKAFVEEYPEITSRFLRVLDRTQKWIDENPDEAVALAAKVNATDEESTRVSLEARGRAISIDTEYLEDPFGKTLQFAKDQGLVDKDLSYDEIVDTSYFDAAGIE